MGFYEFYQIGMIYIKCLKIGKLKRESKYLPFIFSVTRRSRSDESHLLSVSIDFTDVTLVSDDT